MLGPACLALALAGPFRVARIPFVGPLIVQLLLGQFHCARAQAQRDRAEGTHQTAVESRVQMPSRCRFRRSLKAKTSMCRLYSEQAVAKGILPAAKIILATGKNKAALVF